MTDSFDAALLIENVPRELRDLPQWVVWRMEPVPGRDKPTKVPYSRYGSKASTTNAKTWSSLDDALAARANGSYDGVGFVFKGDTFTGIDLDHCRDVATGAIAPWATSILEKVSSYSEASPSGTGVHVIVRGTLTGPGRNRRHLNIQRAHPEAAIEMYDKGRYFTVTGQRLTEYPAGIENRQDAVNALYAKLDTPKPKEKKPRPAAPTPDLPDSALIEKAMAARNGDAFRRLWDGDTRGHGGDDSAADLALCNMLAFWCGPDAARINRLFRQSGLYREKWDRDDYRDATIEKALEGKTDFFGSHRPGSGAGRAAAAEAANATAAVDVLIPGQHIDDRGEVYEVGTDDFAKAVLDGLPLGALYRMDFVVGEIVGEPGARRFAEVTDHRLRAIVDGHVRLAKWTPPRKDKPPVQRFVACSRDQAGVLLAAAGAARRIPELRLLVHHPVYLDDFELAHPGWNAGSGVFYDEPLDLRGLTPRPEGAAAVLRDLVIDFPFKDESSRQNVFGAMTSVVVRPAIKGKVPFHLTMSSLERTGKGKLTDTAIGEAVLGRAIAPMQPGRTEEEREKRISSLLLQGETVVHLDNLPVGEILDSASLASLATSWPEWRGRTLGVSRSPLLPNNLVVFLSGNNPKTTGEIAKRTVPIALQPKDDHPEDRTDFVHPDAEGYARSRRRVVLEALLGMVEAWKVAGRPRAAHRRTMGGFDKWAEIVGGVLACAGLSDWMGNYRAWIRGADEWASDAEALIECWARTHGTEPLRAAQVLEMIRELEIFPAVTSKPTDEARWSALGKRVLTPLTGRPVGIWHVEFDGKGASKRYHLREQLPAGRGSGHPPASEPDAPADSEGSEGSEGSTPNVTCAHTRARTHAGELWDTPQHPSDPSDPSDVTPGADSRADEPGTRRRSGACGA